MSGFKSTDLKSKLFKNPKIEGLMKKKVREYFPYQLRTLVAMVLVILPQNSSNFLPFSLIIGPVVILGEKS